MTDLDIALFLVRVIGNSAIHEAARPDLLEDQLFAEKLIALLERYLIQKKEGKRIFRRQRAEITRGGCAKRVMHCRRCSACTSALGRSERKESHALTTQEGPRLQLKGGEMPIYQSR